MNINFAKVDGRFETACATLAEEALDEIEWRYGTGGGDGETPLAYHNLAHTEAVVSAARAIGNIALYSDRINTRNYDLLLLGAAYHDLEQNKSPGLNQESSAGRLISGMERYEVFEEKDRQVARGIILATIIKSNDQGLVIQKADTFLQEAMVDADLAALGSETEVFWKSAFRILLERSGGVMVEPQEVVGFLEEQENILANHRFLTHEAKGLYPHKSENLEFVTNHLARCRRVLGIEA